MNLLAGQLEDVQVNAVSTRTCPTPSTKRSSTPAPSSRYLSSPGPCWYHKKNLLRVGKLVVRQVKLPFQSASFSQLRSKPVPDPDPEPVPAQYTLGL